MPINVSSINQSVSNYKIVAKSPIAPIKNVPESQVSTIDKPSQLKNPPVQQKTPEEIETDILDIIEQSPSPSLDSVQQLNSSLPPDGLLAQTVLKATCHGCQPDINQVEHQIADIYRDKMQDPPKIEDLAAVVGKMVENYPDINASKNEIIQFLTKVCGDDQKLFEKMFWADQSQNGVQGNGVVGSNTGHYVNSIMASLDQLAATKRLTPELLESLNNFPEMNNMLAPLQNQRLSLIKSVLQNIAFPNTISQHSKGSCCYTTVEMLVAIKNPKQYVQFVADLAEHQAISKEQLALNEDIELPDVSLQPDKFGRSLASTMIQDAFQNQVKTSQGHKYDPDNPGAYVNELDNLIDAIHGFAAYSTQTPKEIALFNKGLNPAQIKNKMIDDIETNLAHNEPVPATLSWYDPGGMKPSGHAVLVTHLDKQANKIYFSNPWGQLHTMPLDEFKLRVDGIQVINTGMHEPFENSKSIIIPHNILDPNQYKPLHWTSYRSVEDHLKIYIKENAKTSYEEANLNGILNPKKINEQFERLKLPISKINDVLQLYQLEKGKLPPPFTSMLLDSLTKENDKDEAIGLIDKAISMAKLSNTYFENFESLNKYQTDKFKNFIEKCDLKTYDLREINLAHLLVGFCHDVNTSKIDNNDKYYLLQPFNLHTPGYSEMFSKSDPNLNLKQENTPLANVFIGNVFPSLRQNFVPSGLGKLIAELIPDATAINNFVNKNKKLEYIV